MNTWNGFVINANKVCLNVLSGCSVHFVADVRTYARTNERKYELPAYTVPTPYEWCRKSKILSKLFRTFMPQ